MKNHRKIELNNQEIEKVSNFVYQGQTIERNKNMKAEINKRISQIWRELGKSNRIFKVNISLSLKKKSFD